MREESALSVLGWREWARLSALGGVMVVAKIDSGARSCALHVTWQRERQVAGQDTVEFALRDPGDGIEQVFQLPVVDRRGVTAASGQREWRTFVRTWLQLGDWRREVEIGLTNRHLLRHRMLIGRSALVGHWLIDPGRTFLLGDLGATA